MTNPKLIPIPFADTGSKNDIPESGAAEPQLATMQAGFPVVTQTPISEGGIPPERNDFNGILNLVTANIAHLNKGLSYEYDADFAGKIGGYPLNAEIMLNNGEKVKSTIANNTNDPNLDMTGWESTKDKNTITTVESIADLIAIQNPKDGQVVYVKSKIGDGGHFEYNIVRGWFRLNETVFNVKHYGAKGDGLTNDTTAFRECAAAVQANNGGRVIIPSGTYIVGRQSFKAGTGYTQELIFELTNVKALIVQSDGAVMKFADGLRFGAFNINTGEPLTHTGSYTGSGNTHMGRMFKLDRVEHVVFEGQLELDGNDANQIIGARYGDKGIQSWSYGLYSIRHTTCNISNVYAHNLLLDGFYLAGLGADTTPTQIYDKAERSRTIMINCISRYNARQGLSLVGGSAFTAIGCDFSYTGKGAYYGTSPMSGVDVEGEISANQDVLFINCKFMYNSNNGIVSDVYSRRNIALENCKLINETSIFVQSDNFNVRNSFIYGRIITDADNKTSIISSHKYTNCLFTDNLSLVDADTIGAFATSYGVVLQASVTNSVYQDCKWQLERHQWADGTYDNRYFDCEFEFNDKTGMYPTSTGHHGYFDNCTFTDARSDVTKPLNITLGRTRDCRIQSSIASALNFTPSVHFNLRDFKAAYPMRDSALPRLIKQNSARYSGAVSDALLISKQALNNTSEKDFISITEESAVPNDNAFYASGAYVIKNNATPTSAIGWSCVTTGYAASTAWVANSAYALNTIRYSGTRVYKAVTAGVTSTVAPNHVSGTTIDGTVTWEYLGERAVFREIGLVGAAVQNAVGTDDTSVKLNALIASLKAANYIA